MEQAIYRELLREWKASKQSVLKLAELLKANGFTVSPSRLYQWESGSDPAHQTPSPEVTDAIARLLGKTIDRSYTIKEAA